MSGFTSRILGYPFVLVLSLLEAGCMGSAHYQKPPEGAIKYGSGPTPVNPDRFKVNSDEYPRYIAREEFLPPNPEYCGLGSCVEMPRIRIANNYAWKVTHNLKGLLIIQSEEYNLAQCRNLADFGGWGSRIMGQWCFGREYFGIYITPDGTVAGGWQLLPRTAGGAERYMYFNADPAKNEGWPEGQVFVPIGQ